MEEEQIEKIEGINWDSPHYFLDSQIFIPRIFEGNPQEETPEGFNGRTIILDGRTSSDLDWSAQRELALEYIKRGLKLFWIIDLGLISGITLPLSNQMQYASLGLALDHFRDTLWKEFKGSTIGLCLYEGSVDFSLGFPWSEDQLESLRSWMQNHFEDIETLFEETGIQIERFQNVTEETLKSNEIGKHLLRLFCRDAVMEYLDILIANLPDALQPYLLLNVNGIDSQAESAQLLNKERFERWHCAIKGSALPYIDMAWGYGDSPYGFIGHTVLSTPKPLNSKVGIYLPTAEMVRPSQYAGLDEMIKFIDQKRISFRIIPESLLITEWDGLDYLVVIPEGLTFQGKRKLQGFNAAGGTVVSLGKEIGLPLEMNKEEWGRSH